MSNGFRAALWTFALMGLGLSITTQADDETPASSAALTGTYTVNPGDILEVSVWKEEDLQRQAIVRPDGFFSFPLTGDIRAEGHTIEAIRQ
jgi:polysaccharide export outer membrane protein